MPRPRFARLPAARQRALLEAAAHEFGAHGFEDASINQILDRAGVSKGAAYYYFDDKEDLFLTVVQHYMAELHVDNFEELVESVTADTFWPRLTDFYRGPIVQSHDIPWAFGVWRAAGEMMRARPGGALAAFANGYLDILRRLLKRGQILGIVRTDLPDDLLMAWVRAVDDASDRWILEHWDELDLAALQAAAERVVDGIRRLIGTHGS